MAWTSCSSYASVGRFFKEFREAPHRSEQAKSFVDRLCEHILRWFAIAAVDNLKTDWTSCIAMNGGGNLVNAASFVGHLIECGVLSHDLVRRHLVKPLMAHYQADGKDGGENIRANAINNLFSAAGNTLLRGLLEPEDVQVCFAALDRHNAGKLQVRCATHSNVSRQI